VATLLNRQQVLLAATDVERILLRQTFARPPLDQWDLLEADSLERVRFLLQHNTCDALLVDETLYPRLERDGLTWLVKFSKAPLVYMSHEQPQLAAVALSQGVEQWMPRELALANPALLDCILRRAHQSALNIDHTRNMTHELRECRRQANRLVSLLWETTTGDAHIRWHSQRQMIERLQEEVARTERHGSPLTLVLGELRTSGSAPVPSEAANLMESWTADQITHAKRRADVAGQYGPGGFMLLLVHTNEQGATSFCRRLQALLEQAPGTSSGPPMSSQVIFGTAGYSSDAFTPKMLLSRAEEVLDQARNVEAGAAI
jgi:GGDEF domain-containing protein